MVVLLQPIDSVSVSKAPDFFKREEASSNDKTECPEALENNRREKL